MVARSYQSRNVSHVNHEVGVALVGYTGDSLKVNDATICRSSGENQRGFKLVRLSSQVVVVDEATLIYPVEVDIVQLA